ncbi:hypothetical protein LCGC14_2381130 [marine sediment metagenome]|uniref:Uncharacterized protein n=1 Tax=marine sediment metagenome TaxID=412755 RepID=A0A0F9EDC6_9ZZZZ
MANVDAPKNANYRGWYHDNLNGIQEAYEAGTRGFGIAKISGESRCATTFSGTSAATTGLLNTVDVLMTMSAASTGNQIEALRAIITADVKTGAWANVIFARLDYSTNGLAHGVGSPICSELSLPGSSVTRGTYYVWQSEIDCPASCAMNGNPIAVMSISTWGDNKTQFDDVGLLFDIGGVTAGSEKFWDTSASGATGDATLKIRVGGTFKYILVADDNN